MGIDWLNPRFEAADGIGIDIQLQSHKLKLFTTLVPMNIPELGAHTAIILTNINSPAGVSP